jgi:hypothetical protein
MSLMVDVEIESMDTAVKQCTQALIDCGATGCFIDIKWAKLNNIPIYPLSKPNPVYCKGRVWPNLNLIPACRT